ncbi:Nucleoside-diphosphate-sugar epimerase [Mycolicibacterium rutilum]|uniref:Nucleoside-diphosphate-sugar epimerase n=1 Tax=Mycolicibacterium rutilum TaxID=370526 RepID=A0A1H6JSB6_MYCRU|nr:SDR family oxidoreductase [Mycolicibacterium rutilum]SEH63816.1 Nucleoside-diphosphate-sugar epimerase [Mycolicibacterium rutilum]
MQVFVTGASGFIGSAVTAELIAAGHQVVGLARSDGAAQAVAAAGAQVHRGDLADPESLRVAAEAADGVIHLAYHHDFSEYSKAAEMDRSAIATLGDALAGSDKPLVVASGMLGLTGAGGVITENDRAPEHSPRLSEGAALSAAARGVRASAVRLPPTVHGEGDRGFVARLIGIARATGVSGYPGEGTNRWCAVHRFDAARLFRSALEAAPAGAMVHAIDDEGIEVRDIAAIIGRHLELPVVSVGQAEVFDHFGWLAPMFSMDAPASSALTRERFGWQPSHPGLIEDLEKGHYFS